MTCRKLQAMEDAAFERHDAATDDDGAELAIEDIAKIQCAMLAGQHYRGCDCRQKVCTDRQGECVDLECPQHSTGVSG